MNSDNIIDTSNMDNYAEELKTFKAPKIGKDVIPHILYGGWKDNYAHQADGTYARGLSHQLVCMEYRDSPPSTSDVLALIGKGYSVIDYYFPQKSELSTKQQITESGFQALVRSSESDLYNQARGLCQSYKNKALKINEDQKEISALKQELANVRKSAKDSASKSATSSVKPVEAEFSAKKS